MVDRLRSPLLPSETDGESITTNADVPVFTTAYDDLSQEDKAIDSAVYLLEGSYNHRFVFHPETADGRRYFLLTHNPWFDRIEFAACLVLVLLAVFEIPAVWVVPRALPLVLEGMSLFVIFYGRHLRVRAIGSYSKYFESSGPVLRMVLLVAVVIEFIIAIALPPHRRLLRIVRPLFLMDTNYGTGMRRVMRQIIVSFFHVLDTMALVLFFIMISAIFAFSLFEKTGGPYFKTYEQSYVSLFILITTANYPDVMMPSFNSSYWAPLFFWTYLLIALFFLMNLLLAIVFTSFSDFLKSKFKRVFQHQRHALRFAYYISEDSHAGGVTYESFKAIMTHFDPQKSSREAMLCFQYLDKDHTGALTLSEFYNFYEVNRLQWHLLSSDSSESFHSKAPESLKGFLQGCKDLSKNKYFEHAIDGLILINTAIVLSLVIKDVDEVSFEHTWQPVFTTAYIVEAMIKILGLGPIDYFSKSWNRFDFTIVSCTIISVIVEEVASGTSTGVFASLFRSLRVLRLLRIRRTFQDILLAMSTLLPRLVVFLGTLFCVYYMFAVIGMFALNHTISELTPANCNCSLLEGYLEPPNYYQLNNFNNLFYSYNTLFELMVVNNWHVIMELHVAATNSTARIYFFLYFLIVVIVVSNIIIAFILEAFQTVYPLIQQHHRAIRDGIDPEDDLLVPRTVTVPIKHALKEVPDLSVRDGISHVTFLSNASLTQADVYAKLYADDLREWLDEDRQREAELVSGHQADSYNDYIRVERQRRSLKS